MNLYIYSDKSFYPDENTVLYYPFKDDQLDKVWSSSIAVTGSKQTLGYTFSSNSAMLINNPPTNCRFISTWIRYNSSWWNYTQTPYPYIWQVCYNFYHTSSTWNQKFQYASSATSGDARRPSSGVISTSSGRRYHMAYWTEWTKVYAYLNGVKVWETTVSPGLVTPSAMAIWNMINETLSDLIWKSVVPTQQEITAYFNRTKSLYWVS